MAEWRKNMKRVKLIVAYDGTNYHGWQTQPNAVTIEEVLNHHLSELLKEEIKVIGASRTDAGVHALGNVAVFDTSARMPADKISYALNTRLPEDIRIQDSCGVPSDFHPRFQKTTKTYEYRILNRRFPDPTRRLNSFYYYYPLDVVKMQEASLYLVGEHDFKSFCCVRTDAESTVRTVCSLDVNKEEDEIHITISGNGFLYNMVRIIAGTLIQVGKGKYEPKYIRQMLEACDRTQAGQTAPPQGLTLMKIEYLDEER